MNACTRIDPKWKPKFILIVTTKEHDTRVFSRVNGRIENPTPGTMLVLRAGKELLATPQKALKGTVQPVKITLIKNDSGVSFDGVMKFVHALSYTHQLTCSPTGLVEPIYQVC
uniref:Piwi domain-containing protein n=1 Tax=Panagrolaimus superbus TaxID=310955 RepID=A0A914YI30_9BILA